MADDADQVISDGLTGLQCVMRDAQARKITWELAPMSSEEEGVVITGYAGSSPPWRVSVFRWRKGIEESYAGAITGVLTVFIPRAMAKVLFEIAQSNRN